MKISELKELIQNLPDDMDVVMPHGDDTFITACYAQSEVIDLPTIEEDEILSVFVIKPCCCEMETDVIPAEPNLN